MSRQSLFDGRFQPDFAFPLYRSFIDTVPVGVWPLSNQMKRFASAPTVLGVGFRNAREWFNWDEGDHKTREICLVRMQGGEPSFRRKLDDTLGRGITKQGIVSNAHFYVSVYNAVTGKLVTARNCENIRFAADSPRGNLWEFCFIYVVK